MLFTAVPFWGDRGTMGRLGLFIAILVALGIVLTSLLGISDN